MVSEDFTEAIKALEREAVASPGPYFVRAAGEVAVALRDAMDVEKRTTALSTLALAGPEIMSTILRRHGRADIAAILEGSSGWDVVMTLRRVAPAAQDVP